MRCIRRTPAPSRRDAAATPARHYSRSYLRHLDKCGEILGIAPQYRTQPVFLSAADGRDPRGHRGRPARAYAAEFHALTANRPRGLRLRDRRRGPTEDEASWAVAPGSSVLYTARLCVAACAANNGCQLWISSSVRPMPRPLRARQAGRRHHRIPALGHDPAWCSTFFLVRPQNKRAKEQREMLTKIAAGDEVATTGAAFSAR